MLRRVSLSAAVLLAAAAAPALLGAQATYPRHHAPRPTEAAITSGDLMTRLYIFADDSMMGREMGTLGNVKGTDYIAAEVKRMGLVPAGENGTYFQTVPYKTRALDTMSVIAVGSTKLALGTDWIPSSSDARKVSLSAVYGGTLAAGAHVDITPQQANGKLVVLSVGDSVGFRALRGLNIPGAAGVALVMLRSRPQGGRGGGGFASFFLRPRGFVDDPDAPQPPGASNASGPVSLQISETAAAKMFSKPLDQLEVGASGKKVSVDIRYRVEPMPYPSRNVVAILPGSDPQLRGEYVALGGHNDHNGVSNRPVAEDSLRIYNHIVRPEGADSRGQASPEQMAEVNKQLEVYRSLHPGPIRMDSINNGADDDGSGSVSVLEIAEKLAAMNPRPKRSILFVWHVGEEKGLLGSRYFTDHPTVPRDSIVGQLNMDMVGRGDANDETGITKDGTPLRGGPGYVMLVGSRRLSTEMGDLIERVNTEDNHNLVFDYAFDVEGHPSRIYCRSDHYEYARYGIPITFFTTGLHSDYHQVSDEPEYIDYAHMAQIDNLIEDVAVHVANLDHRLVVDHPKPDPFGVCR